jgi:hypothetical protein
LHPRERNASAVGKPEHVFQIDFRNGIEARHTSGTEVPEANSGDTRNPGFEGQTTP